MKKAIKCKLKPLEKYHIASRNANLSPPVSTIHHYHSAVVSDMDKLWASTQKVVASAAQEGQATSPVTCAQPT